MAARAQPPAWTLADLTIFYGPTSGGVRTYLAQKRAFLAARGHRHLLVVPGPTDGVRDEPEGRVVTVRGPGLPFAPGYRAILRPWRVTEILVRERPALVEVGDPYLLPWAAYRARARIGARVVLFAHSDFVETYLRPGLGRAGAAAGWAYARAVYRRADLVLAPSPAAAATLAAHGVAGVEVLPLGVDTACFRPDRRRDELRRALAADGRPVCLYAGRLSPEKGLATLLGALPRLAAGGAVLWVAGAGRLEPQLAAAARRYPIRLLGFVGGAERMADLYAAADAVVVPGAHETLGLAALEALACGTPVVAAAAGGPADLVTPEVGALVPPGDPAALADAALRVMREERAARTEACRRRAEAYAWGPALARLLDRYERLLAARAAPEAITGAPVEPEAPRGGGPGSHPEPGREGTAARESGRGGQTVGTRE